MRQAPEVSQQSPAATSIFSLLSLIKVTDVKKPTKANEKSITPLMCLRMIVTYFRQAGRSTLQPMPSLHRLRANNFAALKTSEENN